MADSIMEVVSWDDKVFMVYGKQTIHGVIMRRTVTLFFLGYVRQFFGSENPRHRLWEFHNLKTREREHLYHVKKE